MSEYVSKKAVLEWLKEQQKQQEENRDRLEIDHPYWEYHEGASDYLSLSVEKIQSGAFDAPDTEHITAYWAREGLIKHQQEEIKRLREALEYILEYWNRDENERAMSDALWKIIEIANEALSTTTEQAERVRDTLDSIKLTVALKWLKEIESVRSATSMLATAALAEIESINNAPEGDGNA